MSTRTLLQTPTHRLVVRWSLFRPLLLAANIPQLEPTQQQALKSYVRDEFRRNRKLQSEQRIRRKLIEGEKFLHDLHEASTSTVILDRMRQLASHLTARHSVSPRLPRQPSSPAPSPRTTRRPSIIHSTLFHPPMQRLRPQPIGLSMMIFNRRRAMQKRFDRVVVAKELAGYGRDEEQFENAVGVGKAAGGRWGAEWQDWIREAKGKEMKEYKRNEMRISPELQAQARKANRQRERQRAARAVQSQDAPLASRSR
ncbi:hypothetical protein JCM8097_002369 [Rhodosporidiobolus ruineniae]